MQATRDLTAQKRLAAVDAAMQAFVSGAYERVSPSPQGATGEADWFQSSKRCSHLMQEFQRVPPMLLSSATVLGTRHLFKLA